MTGGTLRIVGAQVEDRGIYLCLAENSAGQDQAWVIVEVLRKLFRISLQNIVYRKLFKITQYIPVNFVFVFILYSSMLARAKPTITLYPEETATATIGGSAMFVCRASGEPQPTVTWTR